MDFFTYKNGELWCDGVPASDLVARFGTPLYVYSARTLREHVRRLEAAFAEVEPLLCYAVKANGCDAVLREILGAGRRVGMDVVSVGELERAYLAGTPMDRIVFAGVGKGESEIRAALRGDCSALRGWVGVDANTLTSRGSVRCLNVESEQELELIARVAGELGVCATAALRVNPDVDAFTHAYTTTGKADNKFGVAIQRAVDLFERFGRRSRTAHVLRLTGLHVHLGSPIYTTAPFEQALSKISVLITELRERGHVLESLDIGGGFAADYETGRTPAYDVYARAIVPLLKRLRTGPDPLSIVMEPGRTLVANAGVLLTGVRYTKQNGGKHFVVCDAGMNALIRPALYDAFHFLWPVRVDPRQSPPERRVDLDLPALAPVDVVGPICESGDFLARDRRLPVLRPGDTVAVFGAGAYGMSMASNYNDQPLPAEVMVDQDQATLVRARQSIAQMFEHERAGLSPRG